MACNVFEEDPAGSNLGDDAGDVGPEMAFVIGAPALSGGAERLAGVSGEDCVDAASPLGSVEGGDVIPDRGRGEVSGPLRGDEGLTGVLLPLDEAGGFEPRLCEHETHVEPSGAGAEGEAACGGR